MPNDSRQIPTTHIGSLPRPPELLDLLKRRQDGEQVDEQEPAKPLRQPSETVVLRQVYAGIVSANGGE